MNALQSKKQGFTIIEVVLVLAIAALIFLMIFIALPALQRGQRDTARKNDASAVAAAVNSFRANNRGGFGTVGNAGAGNLNNANIQGYLDGLDQYVKTDVTVSGSGAASVNATTTTVLIRASAKCPVPMPAPSAAGATQIAVALTPGSTRQAAVVTALENNGSQLTAHCVDA